MTNKPIDKDLMEVCKASQDGRLKKEFDMMSDRAKPIIFNGEMVRAILDGRKTQTRRIVKSILGVNAEGAYFDKETDRWYFQNWDKPNPVDPCIGKCPYGKVGDILWVRETWAMSGLNRVEYKAFPADGKDFRAVSKWKPSIHMPKWASRITLEITDVRVERVQEISEMNSLREGTMPTNFASARGNFALLWNSIHGKDAWDRNDWAWVVTFRRHYER